MKKVLLVAINARYTHSCLALYCLKSFSAGLDYDIIIREFSINRAHNEIIADILALRPDMLAISVFIWNAELVKKILPAFIRQAGGVKIVLGGPEVSYNPDRWLSLFPEIDHIIIGEGEAAFRHLLEKGPEAEKKIIRIRNPHFGTLPVPYSPEDLVHLKNKYVYYESSRGCPHKCSYCLSSRSDQRLEFKGVSDVERELDLIMARGPHLIKFVDRTFNVRKEHYRAIWKLLIDKYSDGDATFHFEIHPYYLDDEDFDLLSSCPQKLFQFEIGVQSINPLARRAVGRAGSWEAEKAAIKRLVELGTIHIHLDLIAGLPFEDFGSFRRSVDELFSLNPGHLQIGFLKVLPGTDMFDRAEELGILYSELPPYTVRETRWLKRSEVCALERIALLADRLFNTGRFKLTLTQLTNLHGSAFDMYADMDKYANIHQTRLSRKWESGAEFLLGFIRSRHPRKMEFFLDTIRWDWCMNRLSHHYPEIISPRGAAAAKKAGCEYFSKLSLTDIVDFKGIAFARSDLRRSVFYRAESREFMKAFMDNNRYALFLPGRSDVVLFNLGEDQYKKN